ncbi:MAG: glucose-1-phosphate adenylyltransferase subunit GlgD [Clostridia bacterium]
MNALGVLFSNIHDEDLDGLTNNRSTASVPYGGRYRLIDFTLSNLVNADIFNIAIITKTNYHSLMDHIESGKAWDLNRKNGGLSIFPPFATNTQKSVYRGKLEALIGLKKFLENTKEDFVVLSDCNLVCALNMKDVLAKHQEMENDITMVYQNSKTVREQDLVLQIDGNSFVTSAAVAIRKGDRPCPVSLGIYVMKKELLIHIIEDAYGQGLIHFEREYLPKYLSRMKVWAYESRGYTAVIKSVEDYYSASMDLLDRNVREELFYTENIYTKVKDTPPAKYGTHASVSNSFIADGTVIDGTVENSIIFRGVHIEKGAHVQNSIVMQASVIQENARLNYVITDKNVIITRGNTLAGLENYPLVIIKDRVV